MRYLLLIPAVIAMFLCVFFYVGAVRFRFDTAWVNVGLYAAGFGFQFTAIYFGHLMDLAK